MNAVGGAVKNYKHKRISRTEYDRIGREKFRKSLIPVHELFRADQWACSSYASPERKTVVPFSFQSISKCELGDLGSLPVFKQCKAKKVDGKQASVQSLVWKPHPYQTRVRRRYGVTRDGACPLAPYQMQASCRLGFGPCSTAPMRSTWQKEIGSRGYTNSSQIWMNKNNRRTFPTKLTCPW